MTRIKQLSIVLASVLVIPITVLAFSPPTIPLLVYGNVIIDGQPASVNTEISAEIDNIKVAVATMINQGTYFIEIPDGKANEGKTIVFKVNGIANGNNQLKSANIDTTPSIKFDLVVTTPSAPITGGGGATGGGGGAVGDETAPIISDVKVNTSRTTAVISWQTNEPSISWISYGTSADYGKEAKTANYTTNHSMTIKNLSPSTTYHFQIKSKDSAGNIGQYTDKTFTTLTVQIKGDVNDDGKVNKYDFALMMSEWGKTGLNIASDLNDDGKVDKYDFSLLMINWSI